MERMIKRWREICTNRGLNRGLQQPIGHGGRKWGLWRHIARLGAFLGPNGHTWRAFWQRPIKGCCSIVVTHRALSVNQRRGLRARPPGFSTPPSPSDLQHCDLSTFCLNTCGATKDAFRGRRRQNQPHCVAGSVYRWSKWSVKCNISRSQETFF